ncbi:MAG: glycine--tRNA ligase subunit beta [Spirochaetes bacterium]|nr:glycine--tRNA ligase subunit beta [Spirochaetota bacterium]
MDKNNTATGNINFLCEIGTEEIPAGYIPPAIDYVESMFRKKLAENRITYRNIVVYATPRRIAILGDEIALSQESVEEEIKGPSAKAAYDENGNPTKALLGFMHSNNVSISSVYKKSTDKGEYVFCKKRLEGKRTKDIIPTVLEEIVLSIPFPKRMRWSNKKASFARPIRYFLVLFNDEVIPLSIENIPYGNLTRGHYIQKNKMIPINSIKDYERILEENWVIVNHQRRKEIIRNALEEAAKKVGGMLVSDEELLDTVTFLVEKPEIVVCEFDPSYLEIPDIVLITEMKEHQKYFAVRDSRGVLMNKFLVVSNNPHTPFVKAGNERVIAARFNDGRFFFNEDRKRKLEEFVESLKAVLFHKELGTIFQKVERMGEIARTISEKLSLSKDDVAKIMRAIYLSKADLNTAMVFEFTSLQGKIGKVYALLDGEDPEVAEAIDAQYRPRFSGDNLPQGIVSIVVSMSEKLDNIFGSFSVGNIPKGSQDPYALRRQANAIVEMLIEGNIALSLDLVLKEIAPLYRNGEQLIDKILDFINARAKTIFSERGFRYDEIDACLSIGYYDYLELYRRAKSIHEYRKKEQFSDLLLSLKRMNNIYSAFRQRNREYSLAFEASLLLENAEKELYEFFETKKMQIRNYIQQNKYIALFDLLITGKPIIDKFFDKVMVMADDIKLRDNRLALLENILHPFKNLMDFSKISE